MAVFHGTLTDEQMIEELAYIKEQLALGDSGSAERRVGSVMRPRLWSPGRNDCFPVGMILIDAVSVVGDDHPEYFPRVTKPDTSS